MVFNLLHTVQTHDSFKFNKTPSHLLTFGEVPFLKITFQTTGPKGTNVEKNEIHNFPK